MISFEVTTLVAWRECSLRKLALRTKRVILIAAAAVMAAPVVSAIVAVTFALKALAVTLWANPIVLIIGAIIAAIAGAAFLIYKYCE